MGVKLLGKIKIHEIAKKVGLTSKEVIEKAKKLGIAVTSHLSTVEDEQAVRLEQALSNDKIKNVGKKEKKVKEKEIETPVIIRRELIISDDDKKTEKQQENKHSDNRKDVGFVEREKNQNYNIVYRNKPTKPLTVNELFGIKEPKKEEPKTPVVEEQKVNEEKTVKNEEIKTTIQETKPIPTTSATPKTEPKKVENPNKGYNQNNGNYNFNRNNSNNNYNQNRNNYNQNRNYNNGDNNRPQYNRDNNRFQNRNNNGQQRPNFNKNEKRPLDNKGIDRNIKDIMSVEIEKENQRDYSTKAIDKQKVNNKYEEQKINKKASRKSGRFDSFDGEKLKNLKQVDKLSHMFNEQDGEMLDYYDLTTERGKKNKKRVQKEEERNKQKIFELKEITIPETITVKDLAMEMKKTSGDVIKKLLNYGIMSTINNTIDFDTAYLVASEFGITAKKKEEIKEEDILFDETEDTVDELQPRPPVVVVMGHVDHGKTSLLDAIRSTNVIEGEAGGITQHIGAYKVNVNNREITFLDTPGHEAFTSMRARGAQITDIAILVVAADDGVMPQTVEAINHAKAAGIPIIVAVNKIDLPNANVDKIKQELMEYELVPEEWGGDTIFCPISAKKNINIDNLLEMVLLVADMKELKANPNKQAKGVVIEARLDKAKGPIASMLVQRGTLDEGDTIVVGTSIGRIRAMKNDKGQRIKKAGPSTPVEIMGLTNVPEAGETFYEVKDEKMAKHLIERRKRQERENIINENSKVTLSNVFEKMENENLKQLYLIVKADVQGTAQALKQSLEKLSNDEVKVKVIHSSTGAVTESDVQLAKAANAIIIAFNVRPGHTAKDIAEKNMIEIKQYSVIYQAIEDVEAAMKGMLDPIYEEKIIGNAEVRQTFKVSNVGTVAGCYVLDGKIERHAGVRVIREGIVLHDGKLESLKRFKDDVKEVAKGYECGIQIEKYNDIKEGDIIEVYIMQEVKR
jgi:translation initiation factor IF-2